jgi:YHS domain-containing protein
MLSGLPTTTCAGSGLQRAGARRSGLHQPRRVGPDTPPAEPTRFPAPSEPAGTIQFYAYEREVPGDVWNRLRAKLATSGPSGEPRPKYRKVGWPTTVHDKSRPTNPEGTATNPVCGACIRKDEAGAEVVYDGGTYYFCGPECQTAFGANPERYIKR